MRVHAWFGGIEAVCEAGGNGGLVTEVWLGWLVPGNCA